MLKIYLTNLGKYVEGYLIGEWVTLPVDDDELEEVKKRIGINNEEYFITDYESDIEIISALLSEGYTMEEALEKKDDCCIWYDCENMTDIAYKLCDDFDILRNIPDVLKAYFDFEAYGRDLAFENTFIFTSAGNCVEILY